MVATVVDDDGERGGLLPRIYARHHGRRLVRSGRPFNWNCPKEYPSVPNQKKA